VRVGRCKVRGMRLGDFRCGVLYGLLEVLRVSVGVQHFEIIRRRAVVR